MKIFNLASILTILVLSFTALFLSVGSAEALTNYKSGDVVELSKKEIINGDYFVAGGTVQLDGTINGDAYIAGGNIAINGTVNGDIIAVGGNISLNGTILGNIRVVGGQVVISSNVGKNITVAGGLISLRNTVSVPGSVVAAGGTISLARPIDKGVTLAGSAVTIDTTIGGDVVGAVEKLSLSSHTKIGGNLTYWSHDKATIASGAAIQKQVYYHQTNVAMKKPQQTKGLNIASIVLSTLTLFVVGLVFLNLVPIYTQNIVNTVVTKPWLSLGVGFLATLLLPLAVILLLFSIIGIPFAIMLLMVFIIIAFLNIIFMALAVGQRFLPGRNILGLLLGLMIFELISLIPIIGGIIGMIVFFVGLGAFIMTKKDMYLTLRTKKLI